MIIYVAGKFRGKNRWAVEQNVRLAEEAAFEVCKLGHTALCPHTMYRNFDGTLTDKFWLKATMELLRVSDAVYAVSGWENSEGARAEITEARLLGLHVYEKIGDIPNAAR